MLHYLDHLLHINTTVFSELSKFSVCKFSTTLISTVAWEGRSSTKTGKLTFWRSLTNYTSLMAYASEFFAGLEDTADLCEVCA
jgi:hypothetical protein